MSACNLAPRRRQQWKSPQVVVSQRKDWPCLPVVARRWPLHQVTELGKSRGCGKSPDSLRFLCPVSKKLQDCSELCKPSGPSARKSIKVGTPSAYLSPRRPSLPLQSDTSLCTFTLYHRNMKPVVDRGLFFGGGGLSLGTWWSRSLRIISWGDTG